MVTGLVGGRFSPVCVWACKPSGKRHLLVDTRGLVLRAVVHSAPVQDRAGAKLALTGIRDLFPQFGLVWVDGGYVNVVDAGLVGRAAEHENREIVAVPRNADVKGFHVLPRRWVVERTISWPGRCRRLARDWTTSARPRTPKR